MYQDGIMCSRDVAVVYYLTKDWKEEYGGCFIDHGATNGKKTYVLEFNSLIAFMVPRFHEVTTVKVRNMYRFSFFGWFLTEGDLYSFAKSEEKSTCDHGGKRRKKQNKYAIKQF